MAEYPRPQDEKYKPMFSYILSITVVKLTYNAILSTFSRHCSVSHAKIYRGIRIEYRWVCCAQRARLSRLEWCSYARRLWIMESRDGPARWIINTITRTVEIIYNARRTRIRSANRRVGQRCVIQWVVRKKFNRGHSSPNVNIWRYH